MGQRVTYRRRHSYNTKSNKVKLIRTPGGVLTVQYRKKQGKVPACGDCGQLLSGIPQLRSGVASRVSKRVKTVSRAYGGNRCANCVKTRIVRAFLIEEQKIVKRVLRAKQAEEKKAVEKKPAAKKAAPKKAAKKAGAKAAAPKKTAAAKGKAQRK